MRYSTSISREDLLFLEELFNALLRGADVSVLLRSSRFSSTAARFNRMLKQQPQARKKKQRDQVNASMEGA